MLGLTQTQTITGANLNRKDWCAAKNNNNYERKEDAVKQKRKK